MSERKKLAPYAGAAPKLSREEWWKSEGEDEILESLEEQFGAAVYFQGDKVSDYLWPGLTDEQMFDPTFEVVVRADYNRDFAPLIEFIRKDGTELSGWGGELLADFIHRTNVHKRMPIYRLSRPVLALLRAKKLIREKVADGLVFIDDAIIKVAHQEAIPETTLTLSWQSKLGYERRALAAFRGAALDSI